MRLPFKIDPGRALFAVALAVLLYFVALNETNPEGRNLTSFTVPVQPVNVPAGLVVTAAPPRETSEGSAIIGQEPSRSSKWSRER